MRRAVLNVVGLSVRDLTSGVMPRLAARATKGSVAKVHPAFPAVTCTAQSDYLTGKQPSEHGIVGNGWYDRTLSEVQFWKQSNRVVGAPKVWDELHAKNPKLKVSNLFWWYNMGTAADISVTPRPVYKADGGKIFDIASYPQRFKELLKRELGDFPFHSFWGPRAGLPASQWIADSARWIEEHEQPDLNLVYLPHLDYDLQRFGPADSRCDTARRDVDQLVGDLAEFLEARGVEVLIVSEYAITAVDRAVPLNKILRKHDWLELKPEAGSLTLDTFNSKAFAVVDHQVAHVVVLDPSVREQVRKVLLATPGVAQVLDAEGQAAAGIKHVRSGDFVVVADDHSWFSYYWWEEGDGDPDFARTVDIHRKPGYDPVELFIDPKIRFPMLSVAWFLLKKKLGFKALMKVISQDASLVKGSHGRIPEDSLDWPVLIAPVSAALPSQMASTDVYGQIAKGF
ncbi:MAG: nucleotide pyrophosphatase/phosphodiesterase family protein [Verrucomicrobiota bacterium]|jgi:predicted AlkP superfamily pyrophosphatase or phosphodiesterase